MCLIHPLPACTITDTCWCRLCVSCSLSVLAVTVNVSRLYPLTVPLTQNGTAVRVDGTPEMLFRPVIHLFGNKNRTLSGEVLKVSDNMPVVDVGTQQPRCVLGQPNACVCLPDLGTVVGRHQRDACLGHLTAAEATAPLPEQCQQHARHCAGNDAVTASTLPQLSDTVALHCALLCRAFRTWSMTT